MSGVEWISRDFLLVSILIGAIGVAVAGGILYLMVLFRGAVVAVGCVLAAAAVLGCVALNLVYLNTWPTRTNVSSLSDGYGITSAEARALVEAGSSDSLPVTIEGEPKRVSLQLSSDRERAFLVEDGHRVPLPR